MKLHIVMSFIFECIHQLTVVLFFSGAAQHVEFIFQKQTSVFQALMTIAQVDGYSERVDGYSESVDQWCEMVQTNCVHLSSVQRAS